VGVGRRGAGHDEMVGGGCEEALPEFVCVGVFERVVAEFVGRFVRQMLEELLYAVGDLVACAELGPRFF